MATSTDDFKMGLKMFTIDQSNTDGYKISPEAEMQLVGHCGWTKWAFDLI